MFTASASEVATKLSSVRALKEAAAKDQPLVTVCSACHNVVKQTNNAMQKDKEFAAKVNRYMNERIPKELSCAWDNDGLMCSPDTSTEVERVLIALDVTEDVVDYAIFSHFDLIITHHPLIFKPLTSVTEENHVARKIIKLLENGVSVFSFHTRADKVSDFVVKGLCGREQRARRKPAALRVPPRCPVQRIRPSGSRTGGRRCWPGTLRCGCCTRAQSRCSSGGQAVSRLPAR